MRYSNLKGWSKPHKYGKKRVKLVKILYWFKLLKLLIEEKIVINVDESSFDWSIKKHYSLLSKGEMLPYWTKTLKEKLSFFLESGAMESSLQLS